MWIADTIQYTPEKTPFPRSRWSASACCTKLLPFLTSQTPRSFFGNQKSTFEHRSFSAFLGNRRPAFMIAAKTDLTPFILGFVLGEKFPPNLFGTSKQASNIGTRRRCNALSYLIRLLHRSTHRHTTKKCPLFIPPPSTASTFIPSFFKSVCTICS